MIRRKPRKLRYCFAFTKRDLNLLLRALSKAHDLEWRNDVHAAYARLGRRIADAKGRLLA